MGVTSEFHIPRAALLFVGAFDHVNFNPRIICVGAPSGHARLPARNPRPWSVPRGEMEDISQWRMAERCEHEQILLKDTMPRWFQQYGVKQPSRERFEQAARQLR